MATNWACWEDQLEEVVAEYLGDIHAVGTTEQIRTGE